MAFVFRSPRHITHQQSIEYTGEQIAAQSKQQQSISSGSVTIKKPIKGSTCHKNSNTLEQYQTALWIANNPKLMFQNGEKHQTTPKKITQKEQFNDQYQIKQKNEKFLHKNDEQFKCKGKKISEKQNNCLKTYKNSQQNVDYLTKHKKILNNKINKKKNQSHNLQNQQSIQSPLREIQLVGINTNLLTSKMALGEVYSIPSIPGQYEKYGYVVNENHISYPKLITRPKNDYPGPTDYTYTIPNKVKSVLNFTTKSQMVLKIKDPSEESALINDQQALTNHNNKIKQWLQQTKKLRTATKLNKQKNIKQEQNQKQLSSTSNDSSQIINQDNTTPGPGYYHYEQNSKKDFRSKNQSIRAIFYSKSNRFDHVYKKKCNLFGKYAKNLIGQELTNSQPKQSKNKFFVSKLKRQINFQTNSTTPPPGHYNVRLSIENDIIEKILKTSPNTFNNKLPRLPNMISSNTPSPGTYQLKQPNFNIQHRSPLQNKKQKSIDKRYCDGLLNLNEKQQELIEPYHYQEIQPIHQRKQNLLKPLTNMAPFLTKSSKGFPPIESPLQSNHIKLQKPQKIKTTRKQNIYPFNSSDQRNKQIYPHYVASIGLYDLTRDNQMEKKSFNILFN